MNRRYLWLGLSLLAASLYANSLGGKFLNYDDWWLVHNPKMVTWLTPSGFGRLVTDFSEPARMDYGAEYLPVRDLSAALQYRAFGENPFPYHVVQVLLFAFCSVAVFELFLTIGASLTVSTIGALVFIVHPIHVESVAWLSGHKDLLSLAFLLAMLLAYARGKLLLSLLFFILGFFSKYHLIVAPAFLPLIDQCQGRKLKVTRYLSFLCFALFGYWLAMLVSDTVLYAHIKKDFTWVQTIRTLPVLFDAAIGQLIYPLQLQLMYPFDWPSTWGDPRIWRGLGAALTFSMIGWWGWLRRPIATLGVAFLLIGVIPMLRAPEIHLLADRYLLIPSIGLALLVGIGLESVRAARLRNLLVVLFCLTFGFLTVAQNRVWKDSVSLWGHAAHGLKPLSMKTLENFASVYRDAGNYEASLSAYKLILGRLPEKHPKAASPWFGVGACELALGHLAQAEQAFTIALELKPDSLISKKNLGVALARQKKWDRAKKTFEEVLRQAPEDADTYFNLALIAMERRELRSLPTYLGKLKRLAPNDPRLTVIERELKRNRVKR